MQVDWTQLIGEWLFTLFLFNLILIPAILISILIMHFLMPNKVLDTYFKPPFFRDFECMFFSGIPFAPLRTVMFMRAIAYPASGKKRGITEAHLLTPSWYRLISKILVIISVAAFVLMIVFMVGMGIVFILKEGV